MNRQSLDLLTVKNLPRYDDPEEAYEKGKQYVYQKKESAPEPRASARALREFPLLGDALIWARNNLGADAFFIVSV